MRTQLLASVLVVATASFARPLAAKEEKAAICFVGAVDQDNQGQEPGLTKLFDNAFNGVKNYRVIDRSKWTAAMGAANVDLSKSLKRPAITELSAPLGLSAVLVAVVVAGDSLATRVELRALDPKTGMLIAVVERQVSVDFGAKASSVRLSEAQARQLVAGITRALNVSYVEPTSKPVPSEPPPPPGTIAGEVSRLEAQIQKLAAENAALREAAQQRVIDEAEAKKQAEVDAAAKKKAEAEKNARDQAEAAERAREQDVAPGPKPILPTEKPKDTDNGRWTEVKGRAGKLTIYGTARVDAAWTDSEVNDPRAPMWVMSEGNPTFAAGKERVQNNVDNSTLVISPRLSRFGLDASSAPIEELFGASVGGTFELDMNGAPAQLTKFGTAIESRPMPRVRLFYGKLTWAPFYLLFGQSFDVISPLLPSVNPGQPWWNAGNLGDRQPQIQVGYLPWFGDFGLIAQVSAGQADSRLDQDNDNSGVRDGDDAAFPELQGRVGVAYKHWVKTPITLGVWGTYGQNDMVLLSPLPAVVSERETFRMYGGGFDLDFPITDWLEISGEGWYGKNLADMRGGIGQTIDLRTGQQVRSKGGWAELKLRPLSFWTVATGATADIPDPKDVIDRNKKSLNAGAWLGNSLAFGGFRVGLDYIWMWTEWVQDNPGFANRLDLNLSYSF